MLVQDLAVGLVVPLAFFVLHDAALLIQFFLGDRAQQVAHALRFHPQRHIQRRFWHVLKIIGPIKIGGAIHTGGADQFEWLEVFIIVIFGAVEHEMFEQVCETGFPAFFVFGANVIPDVYRDNWRFVVFVDYQA